MILLLPSLRIIFITFVSSTLFNANRGDDKVEENVIWFPAESNSDSHRLSSIFQCRGLLRRLRNVLIRVSRSNFLFFSRIPSFRRPQTLPRMFLFLFYYLRVWCFSNSFTVYVWPFINSTSLSTSGSWNALNRIFHVVRFIEVEGKIVEQRCVGASRWTKGREFTTK